MTKCEIPTNTSDVQIILKLIMYYGDHRGRDSIVYEFRTTCGIKANDHSCLSSNHDVLDTALCDKVVSDMR